MSESMTWISLNDEANLENSDLFKACCVLAENPIELLDLAGCNGKCASGSCKSS